MERLDDLTGSSLLMRTTIKKNIFRVLFLFQTIFHPSMKSVYEDMDHRHAAFIIHVCKCVIRFYKSSRCDISIQRQIENS
ncbi:hypothetical protein PUN28_008603 [Cardiocondyla obscurior]|uniref:Uncharacterized protein n=1 Tax=Cardiocondyla obscurior TaxID=286306 RepID=A0AAW2G0N5_9HYME